MPDALAELVLDWVESVPLLAAADPPGSTALGEAMAWIISSS